MKNADLKTAAVAVAACLLMLPRPAAACVQCVTEQFEYTLPHMLGWCLGMIIWFVALTAAVKPEDRAALRPLPSSLLKAAGLLLLAFFTGAAWLGPFSFMLLGGISLCATNKAIRPQIWPTLSKRSQIGLKVVSAVAIASILAGLVISMKTRITRSDADFILR
ncbi:hypothetical protein [Candidatus Electronema sp. JM]|uniref:hypothetical protein n=1 Tax=Candidatus Electronema sp. JM TaxID=3401571 RepID=UPI003AA9CCE1